MSSKGGGRQTDGGWLTIATHWFGGEIFGRPFLYFRRWFYGAVFAKTSSLASYDHFFVIDFQFSFWPLLKNCARGTLLPPEPHRDQSELRLKVMG